MNNRKKILSLQGLRAVAFIGIFTEHAGLTHLGSWGVSCFLVLSGFLMYYNYGLNGGGAITIKTNILLAVKRIKTLYPLHCLTFAIAIIVYWDNQRLDSIRHIIIWIIKVALNLSLLQSLVPKSEFYWSFNAVSWYLSTAVIIYFAFPYIRKGINKNKNNYGIVIKYAIIITFQSIISVLLLIFSDWVNNIPVTISDDLTKYVTYICPLYRICDFYLGCLLGYIFHQHFVWLKNSKSASMLELLSFSVILFLQIIEIKQIGIMGSAAFRYSFLYIFNTSLLVYLVSLNRGIISKYILSSPILVSIGNISAYAFLFHQLIIVILRKVYSENKLLIATVSFLLTMFLSYGWSYFKIIKKNRIQKI